MSEDRTPILVGCGQVTDLDTPPETARGQIDILADAARLAAEDCGLGAGLWPHLDHILVLRSFGDTSHRFTSPFGRAVNPPRALAKRLGAAPRREIYTHPGGNMPQWAVNHFAEAIANGDANWVLIGGGEALRTQLAARRAGLELDWQEDDDEPEIVGIPVRGWSDHEDAHNMRAAIVMYPLLENGIRTHRRRSIAAHLQSMAELFARFSAVAKGNPLATRRTGFSAAEIGTIGPDNPYIGFPYPKLMNSNAFVDQSAAILMTSVAEAKRRGVPEDRWVYIHGVADTTEHWYMHERDNYHSCTPIKVMGEKALGMAGLNMNDITAFDLYSCFPSAVEIACDELGLAEDDPRGLTITGGLPYFGGPGNNYVTHSIAHMMDWVRQHRGKFGMVTANGNYVTKHAGAIYSTTPTRGTWQRENPSTYQAALDARPKPPFTETPEGAAEIETYTIMNNRKGPEYGVVIGRLREGGVRFEANTPANPDLLEAMQRQDYMGRAGTVTQQNGRNIFTPNE